jgi:hypothetical protein
VTQKNGNFLKTEQKLKKSKKKKLLTEIEPSGDRGQRNTVRAAVLSPGGKGPGV